MAECMISHKKMLQVHLSLDATCQMIQRMEGTAVIIKDNNHQVTIPPTQWHLLMQHIQFIIKLHQVMNQPD